MLPEIDEGAPRELDLREVSRAALFVALGLAFPAAFHAVRLGHVLLPMYLPVLTAAFLLRPSWAAAVGAATPLVSALATGMPPMFPPIAMWMAVELALMALALSVLSRRTHLPRAALLAGVLVAGRILYAGLVYATGLWLALPARVLGLAALLSAWPGMLLAVAVVPPVAAALAMREARAAPRVADSTGAPPA